MWLSVLFRVPRRTPTYSSNWSLLHASISTSSSQYKRLRAIAEQLRSNTDGLPPLANILRSGSTPDDLPEAGLSQADRTWLQELPSNDFVGSLKLLKGRFGDLKRDGNADLRHDFTTPAWLATHMLYHGARADGDIQKAAALVEQYASIVPPPHSHAIAILTIARLAELQFTSAIRGLIWTFCNSSPLPSQFHCNLLLLSLSLHTECQEMNLLVSSVLQFMARHELKVSEEVYDALLHPRIASLPIVKAIERKMSLEEVQPTMNQLRALFKLMTKRRIHNSATRYLAAMKKLQNEQGDETPVELEPKTRARYVQSLTRPSSAIRVLQRLLPQAEEAQSPLRFRTETPRMAGVGGFRGSDCTALLAVAARSKDVSAEALLEAFHEAVTGHSGNAAAYAVVIHGLLRKRDFARAITVWDTVRSSSVMRLSTTAMTIGVNALTVGGQPHRAFSLLEETRTTYHQWASQVSDGRPPPQVNTVAVNQFMIALTRLGRPDATFALWDYMKTLYGLSPDTHTFNILLGTARWSRKFDDTIIGQLAHLGLAGPSFTPHDSTLDERGRAVAHMDALLDPTHKPRVTGLWHGAPASRVALRLAVELFLGHWPFLRDVVPPTRALRRSRDDAANSPMSDALNSVMALSASADQEPSPLLALVPSDFSACPFPHVMPTDVTFRALIDLLAAEGLHTEISLVLGWQRALRIPPSKATLATALVHWMDVSMDAPLVERFKRTRGRDPFALLSAWMEDWVGQAGMPGSKIMAHEMRRKAFYTDSRYLDIINERNWKVQRAREALELPP